MSLREFVHRLEAGDTTPDEILSLCLRRIARLEPETRAWVAIQPRPCRERGPLAGIPYGAKDIIETLGMPTEYGSALYEGRTGDCDAHVIGMLSRAGAVLLGKTQTTAFASFDPAPTRNPRCPGHTPGGSSAGSAAAVAARMVPFALGTQTLGSVLRPASYCGVCGFKPTFGLIPTDGILPFAPSLDTLGFFTETAADMACLSPRVGGASMPPGLPHLAAFRVDSEDPMRRALAAALARLRALGVDILECEPPPGWDRLAAAARAINDYEGARTHAARYRQFGDRIGARLAALVRRGLELPPGEYASAREHVRAMRIELARLFGEYPAVLTPAAAGPAPAGLASTGDPAHNAPWTALGVPAIAVPLPVSGPPLGLQITAASGRDDALVAAAARIEALLEGEPL